MPHRPRPLSRFLPRLLAMSVVALALAGCKQDVYTKLAEADANDMLGVLLIARLDASKSSPDGKTWNVAVESDQMGRALARRPRRAAQQRPADRKSVV